MAGVAAVMALLQRVLPPEAASRFELALTRADEVPSWCQSRVGECAAVGPSATPGRVALQATTTSALSYGVGMYLRTRCQASLSWVKTGGINSRGCGAPGWIPAPESSLTVWSRSVKWTYYQNVVDSSYSFVWWNISRWQTEIDWMALTGINIGLVYTGQEAVLRDTFAAFGINLTNSSESDLDFFNGPGYLSWSRGQSQAGVGGFDVYSNRKGGALPQWWFEQQAKMGQQQAKRMRELGITTILRGFEGNVPQQLAKLYPKANISQVSATDWLLDALDPLFAKVADAYMTRLIAMFGTDHYYQADGFFNNKVGPWALPRPKTSITRPACKFGPTIPRAYIPNCTTDTPHCTSFATLAAAEEACIALWRPGHACTGVTFQYGKYQLRSGQRPIAAPQGKPSSSWVIENLAQCRPEIPPPSPPVPTPASADAAAHSAAAFSALTRTDPLATWVYQTWIWRGFHSDHLPFLRGWMESIPTGRALMLDQTAEWTPIWSYFGNWSFFDQPYIWCAMSTMGGNVGLYGDLEILNRGPITALHAENSSMAGVGIDPEGINTNPAYFTFLLDSAWRTETTNVSDWLTHWATERCGRTSSSAIEAYHILGETVYADTQEQVYEHHMAYCPTAMPPGLGSGWDRPRGSERPQWYPVQQLHMAWSLLQTAAESECVWPNPALLFDLVDVGREYLSVGPCNERRDALVSANTTKAVHLANASLSELMGDLDELLASSFGFLLGGWIQQARDLAVSAGAPDDADFLEWNARAQVTSWYPVLNCRSGTTAPNELDGLWDYGNKAWSGLVRGFYDRRYQLWADSKTELLQSEDQNVSTALSQAYTASVMDLACRFASATSQRVPSRPTGDAIAISKRLLKKYAPSSPYVRSNL